MKPRDAKSQETLLAGDSVSGPDFLNRTTLLLGNEAIETLSQKQVVIAGCGGVGGAAALLLARMGVGRFVLADPGIFDPPDINRQWGATRSTMGRNKARVYEEMLHDINPDIAVTVYEEGVLETNVDTIVEPADLVVDCLDIVVPLSVRLRVYQLAMAKEVYCVSAPIWGLSTLILFASPGGMILDDVIRHIITEASSKSTLPTGFNEYLFTEHIEAINSHISKGIVPSIGSAVALATSIICSEIVLILLKELNPHWREPYCLPDIFVMNPLDLRYELVDYRKLCPLMD